MDNFEKAVPGAPYFQEQFTTRFANTPGWTDLISHGARLAGMLYFSSALYKDGDKWTLKGVSEKWKLVTKAPEPEHAAASLERSLKKQGKKPYQSDLPKMVHMSIEIEESFRTATLTAISTLRVTRINTTCAPIMAKTSLKKHGNLSKCVRPHLIPPRLKGAANNARISLQRSRNPARRSNGYTALSFVHWSGFARNKYFARRIEKSSDMLPSDETLLAEK